jgi:hypothetical protein
MATPKTKSARLSKAEINKINEISKQRKKVEITGTASTKPRVSASMSKSQPVTVAKSKATPPTKQQVAQAKLRAGGNSAIMSTAKPTAKPKTKPPVKNKVVQMPSNINPFKMTPAQKAEYLKNPERYNK